MDQQKLDRAIGRRLKTLRTQAGMTLNELAGRSGVSRAMIGRVERAQSSATAALLNKLCAALDVTLSDVVALAEKPPERLMRPWELLEPTGPPVVRQELREQPFRVSGAVRAGQPAPSRIATE